MKNYIPNILTLTNLFFGCLAILSLFNGDWHLVPLFWGIGLLFDFSDGLVARALDVHSPLGKELDSLADMVTFGVLPGAVLYHLLAKTLVGEIPDHLVLAALPGFILTLFSALRLAKFNIDTRQSVDFIGLATPSCTGYIVGLLMIHEYNSYGLGEMILNPYLLYGSTLLFSYLLISEIPMFALKTSNPSWTWKGNEARYIFVIGSIIMLITMQEAAFAPGVLLYLTLAAIDNFRTRGSLFINND